MHMTHKKKRICSNYYMGEALLQNVKHHQYLGVELSDDISWAKPIIQTVNGANKVLGLLKRNLWNCPSSTKEIAYKTLVRPKLEYASLIWDPHQNVYKEAIEKVQRRAARFVKNDYSRATSVSNLIENLNWDKFETRRMKARLTTIYKESYGITPSNIHHLLADPTTPVTRASHDLNFKIPHANKNYYKYSLYPRTIPQWNSLPPELKSASSVLSFKQLLDNN